MIKFFFNRFSKVVIGVEAIGLILMPFAGLSIVLEHKIHLTILGIFAAVLYLFIRICASIRWYKNAPKFSGIELQFKKALVPTSYIMAIFGFLTLLFPCAFLLVVAILLLGIIAHVNVILIYLHIKDNDRAPVNCFSGSSHS